MKKLFLMMAVVMTAMLVACSGNKKSNEENVAAEAASEESIIRINCMLTVDAANRDKAIDLCKQLVAASLGDEGVIDYDVLESATRPNKLMIFETWKDQASLDKHSASTHFTTLVPQIQELGNLEIKQLELKKDPQLDPEKPFRFNIMMTTKSGQRDAYISQVKGLIEATLKNDAGNIEYDYFNSLTRADKTMLLEIWENQAALDGHLKAPHFTSRPDTKDLMAGDSEFARMAE
ncbi:MAG: antibiotic biosynthesis monooxygenase [Bacteroidaceae bacterium]|nr:antibiotic biosynthesis monooxygenase [Bacteroidaceae bacterium]